jgi:hypothetical protein
LFPFGNEGVSAGLAAESDAGALAVTTVVSGGKTTKPEGEGLALALPGAGRDNHQTTPAKSRRTSNPHSQTEELKKLFVRLWLFCWLRSLKMLMFVSPRWVFKEAYAYRM